MKRISSQTIWFSKYVSPFLVFAGLIGFVIAIVLTSRLQGGPPLIVVVVPLGVGAIIFQVMRKIIWDLADEVLDWGDFLEVRFGDERDRIPLANIINISYSYMTSPARVTLTLRTPCRFGNEVSFAPPRQFTLIPFVRNPDILELIQRVDAARLAAK